MSIPDLIEIVLKSLTDRIALAGFFLALIFWILAKSLPNSAVGQWANEHLVLVYGVGLFSICYLPTRSIIEWWEHRIASGRKRDDLIKTLQSLGSDDRQVLYNPIRARNMTYQVGGIYYHVWKGLEKRGIVTEVESYGDEHAFTIDREVFDYLTEHPDLVAIMKEK